MNNWQSHPPYHHQPGAEQDSPPPGTNPAAPPVMMPPPGYPPHYPPNAGPYAQPMHTGYPPYYAPPPPPMHAPQYMAPPYMVPPPVAPVPAPAVTPVQLSREDSLRLQIEKSLGGSQLTTAFIGNIADGVTDELLNSIFAICGPVRKWKRMLEATGTPKSFGFLDYELADGLQRLLRLLPGVPLLGKGLNIKVEDNTREYLRRYEEALRAHEGSNPGSPRLSFTLERDLRALEEYTALFKGKNFGPALQFVEKKIIELTVGPAPSEEPKFEQPRVEPAHGGEHRKGSKRSSVTGWETSAYRDRERRWEAREASIQRARMESLEREKERSDRELAEQGKLLEWLNAFDDQSFFFKALDLLGVPEDRHLERALVAGNAPSFYIDRGRWRVRRQRDLRRQIEVDEREERRDHVVFQTQPQPPPPPKVVSTKARKPLVPHSFTYEDLMSAGHDAEAAKAKVAQLKKDKIKALIEQIPTEMADLFAWDLDWDLIDPVKVNTWIKKNVEQWEEVREKTILCEDLGAWIRDRVHPGAMLEQMDGLPDADLFIVRLWRYLIFETEAIAHGIQ